MNIIERLNVRLAERDLHPLTSEQIDCLNDPSRLDEAAAMLEDLRARCRVDLPLPEGEEFGPFDDEDEADTQAEELAEKFAAVAVDATATDDGRSRGHNEFYVIGFTGPDAGLAAACTSWSGAYWLHGKRRSPQ